MTRQGTIIAMFTACAILMGVVQATLGASQGALPGTDKDRSLTFA